MDYAPSGAVDLEVGIRRKYFQWRVNSARRGKVNSSRCSVGTLFLRVTLSAVDPFSRWAFAAQGTAEQMHSIRQT